MNEPTQPPPAAAPHGAGPKLVPMSAPSPAAAKFAKHLSSGEGVYGLILVSGLIATASSAQAPSGRVLLFVAVTLGVFWLAHVYSGVVADYGRTGSNGEPMPLRTVIRESVRDARGMLFAAVFPAGALLLGAFGVMPDRSANWLALWICVGVLACLGYLAYRRRGAALHVRLLGALATASFGLIIILAKAIVTH